MQFSVRKAATRIAVATLAGATLALTPLAAMADAPPEPVQPPTSVSVSDVNVWLPGDGTVVVAFTAALGEEHPPQNGIVQISVQEEEPDCSGTLGTTTQGTFSESGYTDFVLPLAPTTTWVTVQVSASDGLGGFSPVGTYTAFIPITGNGDVPTATVTPDASATSGVFTITTLAQMPSYYFALFINDQLQNTFALDACSVSDVPFSGLAPGDVIDVRSTDVLGFNISTYTVPGAEAKGSQLTTEATDATSELAHTGEVTWPLGLLAIALLGTGSYLAFRKVRQVGPPTS